MNKPWALGFLMDIFGALLMLRALSLAPVSSKIVLPFERCLVLITLDPPDCLLFGTCFVRCLLFSQFRDVDLPFFLSFRIFISRKL